MGVTLDEMREMDGGNFAEKMDAGGITDEKLIEILREKIEAKEVRTFNDKGNIIYSKELEAHDIQLKAVDMSLKLKGRYPAEKKQVSLEGAVQTIPLDEEARLELEAMKEVIRQRAMKIE